MPKLCTVYLVHCTTLYFKIHLYNKNCIDDLQCLHPIFSPALLVGWLESKSRLVRRASAMRLPAMRPRIMPECGARVQSLKISVCGTQHLTFSIFEIPDSKGRLPVLFLLCVLKECRASNNPSSEPLLCTAFDTHPTSLRLLGLHTCDGRTLFSS